MRASMRQIDWSSRRSRVLASTTLIFAIGITLCGDAVAAQSPTSLEAAYATLRAHTCTIHGSDQHGKVIGFGTAFLVSADGYMLTNRHVVSGSATDYQVDCRGRMSTAKVVYRSNTDDFAVVETDFRNTSFLRMSRKHPLAYVGTEVHFMGAPRGRTGSVTNGIVGEQIFRDGELMFSMSALFNPGNSGGSVLDPDGHVVGIVTGLVEKSQGLATIVPAFVVLGDPQFRSIVHDSGSSKIDTATAMLRGSLEDPRTRRIVAFVDQCYESPSLSTRYDDARNLTEDKACRALKAVAPRKPRVGLVWMPQEAFTISIVKILIDEHYEAFYDFFVKRYEGPTRYAILEVKEGESPPGLPTPAAARQNDFPSDWHWLNATR